MEPHPLTRISPRASTPGRSPRSTTPLRPAASSTDRCVSPASRSCRTATLAPSAVSPSTRRRNAEAPQNTDPGNRRTHLSHFSIRQHARSQLRAAFLSCALLSHSMHPRAQFSTLLYSLCNTRTHPQGSAFPHGISSNCTSRMTSRSICAASATATALSISRPLRHRRSKPVTALLTSNLR